MSNSKVALLGRQDILETARGFRWSRQMPKWTVMVDGRELPARPLVLHAAGALPNDPTNSHQAVKILQNHGFEVRYEGKSPESEGAVSRSSARLDELLGRLRGSWKGAGLAAAREREHRIERDRFAK